MTRNCSNEYTYFLKENLTYKSRFSNRKLLHDKTSKKRSISVQKLLHLSLLEFIYIFLNSAKSNVYFREKRRRNLEGLISIRGELVTEAANYNPLGKLSFYTYI